MAVRNLLGQHDRAVPLTCTQTEYETGAISLLQDRANTTLWPDIAPPKRVELVNMLNPGQLARFGLSVDALSEKWEAMDLVSVLEPDRPADYFLLVGNDNDFAARDSLLIRHINVIGGA